MFSNRYSGRRRLAYPKGNESNYVAAFFHMTSIMLLILSCVCFGWFRVYNSARCASHLSLHQFFTTGYFEANSPDSSKKVPSGEVLVTPMNYHTASAVLRCITPEVVNLMRTVIMICIIAIIFSVVGFCLDVIGPKSKLLCFIRRNGIPCVASVLLIVLAISLCYWTTKAIKSAIFAANSQAIIQVTYAPGCYLIAIAGSFSILACACNILQQPAAASSPQHGSAGEGEVILEDDDIMTVMVPAGVHQLMVDQDYWEGPETFSVRMENMRTPPPPYTP
ncbi:transmembrane protein 127 isoform X1 [Nilaparvata lugens]|uniref:transmembrane protein 127 isoform X1 n=1 Tax=Nilaparvata lugens TaxID=108931 RepID=UPI00193DDD93|nr:transmembrane protein 127 isoform X1 [Nilaparvata lugens]XP_039282431.1 transmembrane protein 127 isoform X1 [Nilaparvata lugens]XP_039282432.1 transmembrane protein 127 isoform X1 [Nilaparvata lugens]